MTLPRIFIKIFINKIIIIINIIVIIIINDIIISIDVIVRENFLIDGK